MTDNGKEKLEEIEIEIHDDIFLELAKMAHERDITFNQLANDLLKQYLDELDAEEETKPTERVNKE